MAWGFQHKRFLLGLLILWALLFLGHSWEPGLKMDAMVEASNGKNAALRGEWTQFHFAPRYFTHGFFDHPPLLTWCEALVFKLFGVSDSVARLVPAFFALLTLVGVIVWGSLASNPVSSVPLGLLAGFIFLTSNRYIKFGSDVLLEGPLCCFLVWGAVFFLKSQNTSGSRRLINGLLLGGCLGLAFMTKSVFALILPWGLVLAWGPKKPTVASVVRLSLTSVVGFLLVLGAWVVWGDGGNFIRNHLSIILGRAAERRGNYFFVPLKNILSTYWPWLPFFIWGTVLSLKKKERGNLALHLALAMAVIVFVGLSLSGTFLEHYLIMFFPSAAVVASVALLPWAQRHWKKWEQGLLILSCLFAVILAIFPVSLRRDRTEPLGTVLREMLKVCEGHKEVLVTQSAMEQWMAISSVSWLTPYEAVSVPSPESPALEGQLLITSASESPSKGWEQVPLTYSKLKLYQPSRFTYCHKEMKIDSQDN